LHGKSSLADNLGQVELKCDKLHRGYRVGPRTRKGLQRGYMIPWDKERSLLTFPSSSGTGLVQASLPVPLGQAQPVPICLSHWGRFCLSQLLSQWDRFGTGFTLRVFQSRSLTKFSIIPSQKSKGSCLNFRYSLSKKLIKLVKNLTKDRFFVTFSIVH